MLARAALLPLVLFAPVTFALDPARSISQYGHTTWTVQDGALPDSPTGLAQTIDGYLWVGTRSGLVRFDGVRFVPFAPPLIPTPDGAIIGGTPVHIKGLYTDLPPGDYRFQVVASNNGGVWNESGAGLDFSITPAFYQTRWFDALGITAAAGVLWLLYLLRVRQIEMRIRMRLEERVIERERIARDLHDTLLQSVQGLILRFQAVLARIPEGGERPLQMMEQALERADQVLAEGRDQVYDLRKSTVDCLSRRAAARNTSGIT